MRRDLEAMAAVEHDLVIVGGGITGASVAWDAALRGLKVALLEKDDFAHGTTSGSSKLVHGGLRYLVNGEISLVRESLRERRIWENVAPHMVHPLPFMLPTYGHGMKGGLILSIGLFLYDLLSFDRNWLSDDDHKLPAYRSISKKQALKIMPNLDQKGLTGGKIYYDCQMWMPERLCFEVIAGAVEYGAMVANYAEVTGFDVERLGRAGRVHGVDVVDRHTGKTHRIKGRVIVNASGPWADRMMRLAEDGQPARRLIRSKGIHIVTRNISGNYALTMQSETGGHFFVIPWRGHTLIGTTDTLFEDDPDNLRVSERDLEKFLEVVNGGLPGLNLTRNDILHFYAGLRPLVDHSKEGEAKDSYKASRAAEVCDHAKVDGFEGFVSAIGGKWTTSRHLAEQVVDLVSTKLERKTKCETHCTPTFGGEIGRVKSFVKRAQARHPDLAPELVNHLVNLYGSRIDDVLATANERPEERATLMRRISPNRPDINLQVIHAIRHEMAASLSDVLFRRTGFGTLGHPGVPTMNAICDLMARELDWDEGEIARQMAAAGQAYSTSDGKAA